MQLYNNIERIYRDLNEEGYGTDASIETHIVNKYDCYNYGGPGAAQEAGNLLQLSKSSHVLDVGGGIGPARAIADHTSAIITSVELQKDVAALSEGLNRQCSLDSLICVVHGDILTADIGPDESYDAAVTWLTILHIPLSNREALFNRIFDFLKPGGKMYIEDYFWINQAPFTAAEKEILINDIYINNGEMPSSEAYFTTLKKVGFDIEYEDATKEWTKFTEERLDKFVQNKDRHVRVYNDATYHSLLLL